MRHTEEAEYSCAVNYDATDFELCKETVRMPGTWVAKMWWDQEGLDVVGAQAASEASEERGGGARKIWREKRREWWVTKVWDYLAYNYN